MRVSSSTKHGSVLELILSKVKSGELRPGCRLPSEPDIALQTGVSYMTARKAISELVDQGVLYRVKGRGTFVSNDGLLGSRPSLGLLLVRDWQTLDPFYFPNLVSGFIERAAEQGFEVKLADRSQPLIDTLRFKELRVRAVACVLLVQNDVTDAEALIDRGVSIVAINNYEGSRRVASVSPNNRQGSYDITTALLNLGHRDLVFLGGPSYNLDAIQRRSGFLSAVEDFPEAANTEMIELGFAEEAGYAVAKKLVRIGNLPTAVVCASDSSAIGLMKGLLESGVKVPNEVSVVGFGDFRLSAYYHPALTTVQLPLCELGRRAADCLIDVQYGGKNKSIQLECPLIWRESVAAPRPS